MKHADRMSTGRLAVWLTWTALVIFVITGAVLAMTGHTT